MKYPFFLIPIIFFLIFTIYYINSLGRYSSLNQQIEASKIVISDLSLELHSSNKKIDELSWKLTSSEAISDQRKARIRELLDGYPAGIWACDDEAKLVLFENTVSPPQLEEIIFQLNNNYPRVGASFVKQEDGNVFIKLKNSEELTEKMGISGARCYLKSAVYSITSVDNVTSVTFDFNTGSHASSGNYGRNDFEPL